MRSASRRTFDDPAIIRKAKRISKMQKQLERETGLADIAELPTPKAIKFKDIKHLEPLTEPQKLFFDQWVDEGIEAFLLYGSAGTGKTAIALYHAVLDVLDGVHEKIVIVRSLVQSRDIGFLPGTLGEKMQEYELPYRQLLTEFTGRKDAYAKLKDLGKIEFISTSFLRGTTFKNCIVLFDEAQNESFHLIDTVITRLGKNTRLIICGDGNQDDLIIHKNDVSGWGRLVEVSRRIPEFRCIQFSAEDIVRSGLVKSWILACQAKSPRQKSVLLG